MGKAIGIGGVFLHFKGEKEEIHAWYETHLGLLMGQYGAGFIEGDQLTVITFKDMPEPGMTMLNFRVDDIHSLVDHLKQEGCRIVSDITEYSYGFFAQFEDPFGNVLELWEPNEEEYRAMVMEEVKRYRNEKDNLK